jgi:CHAD domain-containing protein
MPAAATRSELLRKRVDQFTRVLDAVEKGDVGALHLARVASRRMRELVPMLQLEGSVGRKISRRLRKITARLGTVRELDVLLIQIDELHVSGRSGSRGLGRVGVRVSKARDEARKRLSEELPTSEMARLARKLERIGDELAQKERVSSKATVRNWRWAIEARVAKRAARLGAAMSTAGALYLPDRLHAVRIAVKRLRYAVELSAEAAGTRGGADIRLLKRGQDVLGRMHDVQMLVDQVRQTQASLAPPNITVWRELDKLVASLEDDCRRLHARYMRMHDALAALAERRGEQSQASADRAQSQRAG